MKLLTWLSKKFQASSHRFSFGSIASKYLSTGLLSLLVVLVSCQYLWQPTPSALQNATKERKIHPSASVKVLLKSNQHGASILGEFDRSSCQSGFPLQWSLLFSSSLGQHKVELDYSELTASNSRELLLRISPQRFALKLPRQASALEAANLCDLATNENTIQFAQDSAEAIELLNPLKLIAPDCNFNWEGAKGLRCQLTHPSDAEVLANLEALKKNMMTKWNHQPYLLIRRLTLTTQLLQAVLKGEKFEDYGKICRIIQFSLPQELPLSFRSKAWQERVCQTKNPDREVALLGVHDAAQEIQALSRRIEEASLVGRFTLSIPREQNLFREYWISLQPIDTPYVALDTSDKGDQTLPCVWHPLFLDQVEHLLVAMELNVIQKSASSTCAAGPGLANAYREADIYVRSSVASEMEFQISNGQSKQLRLPTGEYQYNIIQYSGPFPDELLMQSDNGPISSGQLSWKNAKPHLIIKNW